MQNFCLFTYSSKSVSAAIRLSRNPHRARFNTQKPITAGKTANIGGGGTAIGGADGESKQVGDTGGCSGSGGGGGGGGTGGDNALKRPDPRLRAGRRNRQGAL